MHISAQGVALIQQFEGFSQHLYRCPAGYLTIGFGHVVRREEVFAQKGMTRQEAATLLMRDVAAAERALGRLVTVPLTQGQWDALTSFIFNLGAGAFQRSTLRRKINRSEHGEVPQELQKWVWAGGRKLRGLVHRRVAEAALYTQ